MVHVILEFSSPNSKIVTYASTDVLFEYNIRKQIKVYQEQPFIRFKGKSYRKHVLVARANLESHLLRILNLNSLDFPNLKGRLLDASKSTVIELHWKFRLQYCIVWAWFLKWASCIFLLQPLLECLFPCQLQRKKNYAGSL